MHGVNAESVMAHFAAPGPGLSVQMDDCTGLDESDESATETNSAGADHHDDHRSSHPAQECAAGQPQQSGPGPAAPVPATTPWERTSLSAPPPGTVSTGAESVEPAARASTETTVLRL
jgi:hypothetical protein